ncbi:MAG: hypothetical protein ACM3QS_02785 [Bacteroidota bacterium]
MRKFAFPLFLISLVLASLACTLFVGGPDYPPDPIPVSPEAAQSVRDQIKQAFETGGVDGLITFQFNESQLTSLLTYRLAQDKNPLLTEPKVLLRDGQMQIYGKVQRSIFLADVAIILSVGIDEAGQPKIEVVSADFGPFPAPQGLNSAISALISEAYTGSVGPVATGFRLENISIANGVMTLSGRIK